MKISKRVMVAMLLVALAGVSVMAQQKRGARRAGSSRTASAPAGRTGALSLQAGIVYKQGGPQPVARVKFLLLNDSLEKLLGEAGFHSKEGSSLGVIDQYAFAVKYGPENQESFDAATKAIAEHTKGTVTTDFNGNAEFAPVPVGTYYVMGVTETRGGFAVWNVKVDINAGKNQIVLDQNNAATAF
jgi:hypothetical protein